MITIIRSHGSYTRDAKGKWCRIILFDFILHHRKEVHKNNSAHIIIMEKEVLSSYLFYFLIDFPNKVGFGSSFPFPKTQFPYLFVTSVV